MNQCLNAQKRRSDLNCNPCLDFSNGSYSLIPINPDVAIGDIPASFLYGFQNGNLETRIKEQCFQSLTVKEQREIYAERKQLTQFRQTALALLIQGKAKELKGLRKPKTPVSQKLDNLVFKMELELTKRVLQNMSLLNKTVLQQEFRLLDADSKKSVHPVNNSHQDSQMITSFFDKLKTATEQAILERQSNNVVYLNQAS